LKHARPNPLILSIRQKLPPLLLALTHTQRARRSLKIRTQLLDIFTRRKMMSSYRRPGRKDWYKTLIFIAVYLVVLGLTAIYLLLSCWYLWMALAAAGLAILVSWHAKATAYHCPRCRYEFEISILTDFLSPHGVSKEGGWTYLKCPNCQHRSRMEMLVKKKHED